MSMLNRLFGGALVEAAVLAAFTAVVAGLIGMILLRRRGRSVSSRDLFRSLLIVTMAVLISVTLIPGHAGMEPMINLIPGRTIAAQLSTGVGRISVANLVGNVLLFAVQAFLVRAGFGWSARKTILAGFALSVAIEMVQLTLQLGRSTDIDDVILNTLGTAIGAALASLASRRGRSGV